ncbi:MAG: 30S ribosomal protein S5 [Phycisphaerae bacterium]|nr:30S ribosomal protein S5 [Phycisphaerae bacterium]
MGTRPQRGRGRGRPRADFDDESGIEDTVVKLYRCATVVKGGRRFSFGALVVVGDRNGQVGHGYGKANEVPPAVEKGIKQARRNMFPVPLRGTTIPHRVIGRFGASRVVMVPAAEGTGVIAGAAPRAVLELAGIKNVLTKCYGSTSPKNLVKATINGLKALRSRATVEKLRGVTLDLPPEREPVEGKEPVTPRADVQEESPAAVAVVESEAAPPTAVAILEVQSETTPETAAPATPEPSTEDTSHDA